MLVSDWENVELEAPLADFKERGYARLGRVLDPHAASALAERANELMLGQRTIPGLFYQHDSESGRDEDLEIGAGWGR